MFASHEKYWGTEAEIPKVTRWRLWKNTIKYFFKRFFKDLKFCYCLRREVATNTKEILPYCIESDQHYFDRQQKIIEKKTRLQIMKQNHDARRRREQEEKLRKLNEKLYGEKK